MADQPSKSPKRDAKDRLDGVFQTLYARKQRRLHVLEMLSRFTDVKPYGGAINLFLAKCPIHTIRQGLAPKTEQDWSLLVFPKIGYILCTKCGAEGYVDFLEDWLKTMINKMMIKQGAGQL